ncbi:hypothetical protein L208DRAFT_1422702 [Tricholoma matsutake]|nr:hypothetical protein L208DRAFT_1422702 [Tricholoma matsutake 945]
MASTIPLITVNPSCPAESTQSNPYRLLYRGALSLPDSHILLDGLTFAACLDSPSKHTQLIQNPLALALESMRGRPSLRLMGIVKLDDDNLWLDESGGIEMDIHPRATLTRIYFENIFCLTPFASTSKSTSVIPDASDIGIKVALGDADGPDTTEIIIFARLPTPDTSTNINLVVARVAPRPPPPLRLPRPDDPTPRQPPLFFGSNATGAAKRELKRMPSTGLIVPGRELKRRSGVRLGDEKRGKKGVDAVFKIPELPLLIAKGKGKMKQIDGEGDVFGGWEMDMGLGVVNRKVENKGKRKRGTQDNEVEDNAEALEMERRNKNAIKKCALNQLSNPKDPSVAAMDKSHPDFKELFGWVYRGVGFALRAQMKIQLVDATLVDHLVKMHVAMYVGGQGGTYKTPEVVSRPNQA